MYLKELDTITHLSYDPCNKILQGSGLSRGSDREITIQTKEGGLEYIKAGKFQVLFYANNKVLEDEEKRLKKFRVSKRNSNLLAKVSKLNNNGRDTLKTVSGIRSVPTLGNQNSE